MIQNLLLSLCVCVCKFEGRKVHQNIKQQFCWAVELQGSFTCFILFKLFKFAIVNMYLYCKFLNNHKDWYENFLVCVKKMCVVPYLSSQKRSSIPYICFSITHSYQVTKTDPGKDSWTIQGQVSKQSITREVRKINLIKGLENCHHHTMVFPSCRK